MTDGSETTDPAFERSADGRFETDLQRLDRHWNDLLQELRVVQTGVQLLTGLLLTLPFQPRFGQLSELQHVVYLITVSFAVAAAALLIAPVGMHRALFRRRRRDALVSAGHHAAIAGLTLLGLAMTGVIFLIFDTVAGLSAALVATACVGALFVGLWIAVPWGFRRRADRGRG